MNKVVGVLGSDAVLLKAKRLITDLVLSAWCIFVSSHGMFQYCNILGDHWSALKNLSYYVMSYSIISLLLEDILTMIFVYD